MRLRVPFRDGILLLRAPRQLKQKNDEKEKKNVFRAVHHTSGADAQRCKTSLQFLILTVGVNYYSPLLPSMFAIEGMECLYSKRLW